jgi:hypothetical protein
MESRIAADRRRRSDEIVVVAAGLNDRAAGFIDRMTPAGPGVESPLIQQG